MDQATQQNAALVEEMAAAASSLNTQAAELVSVVSAFKIVASQDHPALASAQRSSPVAARPRPLARAPQGQGAYIAH